MPSGRYLLTDPFDDTPLGTERFQCAPGPAGWRYTAHLTTPSGAPAGSIDLTTDQLSRPIRLEARTADWQVRGAALDGLTWVRSALTPDTGTEPREGNAHARAFAGTSPAFLVAAARLLRLTPGGPPARLRLVALTHPVLAPRTVEQSWSLVDTESHATDSGPLVVENYRVSDVETGEGGDVHLAGDVVLSAPGVELEQLDAPPSGAMCIQPG